MRALHGGTDEGTGAYRSSDHVPMIAKAPAVVEVLMEAVREAAERR
jgi:hypothetical protein